MVLPCSYNIIPYYVFATLFQFTFVQQATFQATGKLSGIQERKGFFYSSMDNITVVIGTTAAILIATGVAYFYMGGGTSKSTSISGKDDDKYDTQLYIGA